MYTVLFTALHHVYCSVSALHHVYCTVYSSTPHILFCFSSAPCILFSFSTLQLFTVGTVDDLDIIQCDSDSFSMYGIEVGWYHFFVSALHHGYYSASATLPYGL